MVFCTSALHLQHGYAYLESRRIDAANFLQESPHVTPLMGMKALAGMVAARTCAHSRYLTGLHVFHPYLHNQASLHQFQLNLSAMICFVFDVYFTSLTILQEMNQGLRTIWARSKMMP